MKLWPHQERYITRAREQFKLGRRALLLVLPTGAGKTVLATALARSHFGKAGRVLWIVHRAELIKQAAASLRRSDVPCGIIAPWAPRTYEAVQVASIQTLIARSQVLDGITMLVIDEAHHIVADTYLQVRKQYPNAIVIGLTATPGRADNRGLGNAFDSMIAEVQPRELIALHEQDPSMGLTPVRVIGPKTAVDNLCDYPVDAYREHCDGRQCIAFVGSVKEAARLAQAFTMAGYPARSIDGTMSDDERERTIDAFRSGALRVLTSVQVLTEGFDAPETSAVILARKIGSEVTYIQMTGRGMRAAPGKRDCIVLDLYGSSHSLRILPDADRAYSLDGSAVRSAMGELQELTQCKGCGRWFPCGVFSGGKCPTCGWTRPAKPDPRVVHQKMAEIKVERQARMAATPEDQRRIAWIRQRLIAQRGSTRGILTAYKHAFPFPPQRIYPNREILKQSGYTECRMREKALDDTRRSA